MAKKRKITFLRYLHATIKVIVGVLIVGLLLNILSPHFEEFLKSFWDKENHVFYMICILAFCLILLLLSYLLENAETEETTDETKADLRTKFLKNLKQLYEKRLKIVGQRSHPWQICLTGCSQTRRILQA